MLTIRDFSEKETDKNIALAKVKLWLLKDELRKHSGLKKRHIKKEDFEFLINNYGILSVEEIAKKINRAPSCVFEIARKLGLTYLYLKPTEILYHNLICAIEGHRSASNSYTKQLAERRGLKIQKRDRYTIVNIDDFYKWYQSHIKIIPLFDYDGTLPNAPEWFIEKAAADKRAREYLYKRPWSKKEDETLIKMVSEKKTYKEISQTLKRTGSAIKRRCYDLKIQKPKRERPCFWSEEELSKLRQLWLKGYESCIIAEEIDRGDRQIISMLERYKYFGMKPQKFTYSY